MTSVARYTSLALTLALGACDGAPARATAALAPRDAAPPIAAAASVVTATAAPVPRLPLAQRLADEAGQRPGLAVRPAQLREALTASGVSVARARQVLASPIGASYCEAAVSAHGLGLSVCEFPDRAAAEAGSARSHQLFDALMPGRTLVANGNTLLTLSEPGDARAEREAELARALFAELSPRP